MVNPASALSLKFNLLPTICAPVSPIFLNFLATNIDIAYSWLARRFLYAFRHLANFF